MENEDKTELPPLPQTSGSVQPLPSPTEQKPQQLSDPQVVAEVVPTTAQPLVPDDAVAPVSTEEVVTKSEFKSGISSFPLITVFVVIIVILSAIILGMMLFTEPGRRLIGLSNASTSSSISSTSSEGLTTTTNGFSDSTSQQSTDQTTDQTSSQTSEQATVSSGANVENDSQTELGQ